MFVFTFIFRRLTERLYVLLPEKAVNNYFNNITISASTDD